jgi:hypothetical protein
MDALVALHADDGGWAKRAKATLESYGAKASEAKGLLAEPSRSAAGSSTGPCVTVGDVPRAPPPARSSRHITHARCAS